MNQCIFKWTKKLFFHMMDLPIFNSKILFSFWGPKISPQYIRIHFVRNFVEHAGRLGEIHFLRKTNQLTLQQQKQTSFH
jgi:hypothetical protein